MGYPPQGQIDYDVLAKINRWGKFIEEPMWIDGGEVTAPPANTTLVSQTVPTGSLGWIYGFFISAGEANDFLIKWTSGGTENKIRIVFGGAGSLQVVSPIPLNENSPADEETKIEIVNVNDGGSGVVYQARLLWAEEMVK